MGRRGYSALGHKLTSTWTRKVCAVCVFLPCVVGLGLLIFLHLVKCSDASGVDEIKTMCRMYRANMIAGSMCSKLCDEDVIRYLYCGGEKTNKVALILECNGCEGTGITSKLVLKSGGIHNYTSQLTAPFNVTHTFMTKVQKAQNDIVLRLLNRTQLNFSDNSKLLDFILGDDFEAMVNTIDNEHAVDIVLRSIRSLVSQDEFVAIKVFSQTSFMPKLYGTCGPAYFVEYIPSFGYSNHVLLSGRVTDFMKLSQRFPTWAERARIALRVLEFVRKADSTFSKPLFVCDAMPANIGLNSKGEIVLLDSDSVAFENTYIQGKRCRKNKDCRVEKHCYAVCDKSKRTCRKEIKGTNLQRLCKMIFVSEVERFGLLRTPPASVARDLVSLLHRCASPTTPVDPYTNGGSDEYMLTEIERLLKLSLQL